MAIDFNGALTLADQAILSNDPMVKEITKSLHQTWNAVKDIPFYTSPSLRQIGLRYTTLVFRLLRGLELTHSHKL